MAQIKDMVEENFSKALKRLKDLVDIGRGKEDAKIRSGQILNPDNNLTTSFLTNEEIDFINSAYFIDKYYPEFEPMKDYAKVLLQVALSKQGFGIEKIIEYEQAFNEKFITRINPNQNPREINPKQKEERSNDTRM